MDLVVYDDDEKRYVPWTVALAAVLLVALVTAGSTFLLARQASGDEGEGTVSGRSSPAPATAPSPSVTASTAAPPSEVPSSEVPSTAAPTTPAPVAAATPSSACLDALLQADGALERAVALDQLLTQHTAIMDELLAERIGADEALDQTLPVLTDGATERRRFEQELSAYSQSRQGCPA